MKRRNTIFIIILSFIFMTILMINTGVHIEASSKAGKAFKVDSFFVSVDDSRDGSGSTTVSVSWDTVGAGKKPKLNNIIYYAKTRTMKDQKEIKLESTGSRGEEKINVNVAESGYYFFKIVSAKGKNVSEKTFDIPVYISADSGLSYVEGISGRYVDDIAEISWAGIENGHYKAGIYNSDTMEIITEELTDENRLLVNIPESTENVSFYVALVADGKTGDFDLYNLPDRNSPNVMVRFPTAAVISAEEINTDILFTGNCKVDITVNDSVEASEAEASGTYTVPVPEGNVRILVTITAESGNIKNFTKDLLIDTIKPGVVLDKVIDGAVTTDNYIDITGECSEDATLTLGGQKKEVKKGKFSFKHSLSIGENDIKIQAKDKAGNSSNVRAVITRETERKRSLKATLLVGSTFGIILLAYIITFSGWIAGKRKK